MNCVNVKNEDKLIEFIINFLGFEDLEKHREYKFKYGTVYPIIKDGDNIENTLLTKGRKLREEVARRYPNLYSELNREDYIVYLAELVDKALTYDEINGEKLLANGFEHYGLSEEELKNIDSIDPQNLGDFKYVANNFSYLPCHITIRKGYSNSRGRDWTIHIDNCDFQTIASADVQTIGQVNTLLKLMSIRYRINK